MVRFFFQVFVTLFVIMDPPGNAPVFIALVGERSPKERQRLAWQAVVVAGVVVGVFALFGQQILDYFGISVAALQGSGGLLLLLVALELLSGRVADPSRMAEVNVALVPLGTPLIAGPGAIAATIVFVRQAHGVHGALAIGLGLSAVLVLMYLSLRFARGLLRVLRPGGIQLLTRILGLLLSAIAVQLIANSARSFAHLT